MGADRADGGCRTEHRRARRAIALGGPGGLGPRSGSGLGSGDRAPGHAAPRRGAAAPVGLAAAVGPQRRRAGRGAAAKVGATCLARTGFMDMGGVGVSTNGWGGGECNSCVPCHSAHASFVFYYP
ncbi:hypothetical protein NDU88_004706 [Pleurodeles waltl]|uniref:Uncharacterized protein n=1 Tax=Pleurodeles waltl TaxID=8319 RepID=A0AAV7SJQ8_PLEWA|nr:hypothetical protein NDU88_004706 [Pleurodeles waltl]